MRTKVILIWMLLLNSFYCNSQIEKEPNFRREDYLVKNGDKLFIHSKILNENKEIFIGLPEDFNDTTKYPLVVVLEGEVLFETIAPLTRLMAETDEIPECVVVGIPLNNKHLDYAPELSNVPESGNADKMLEFYREELFPLLAEKYHCQKDKIIWAHSALGGIFCTYLLIGADNQFNGIISSSPNLRWMQEYLNKENVFEELAKKDTLFYYLTFGSNEGEDYMGEMYDQVINFKNVLEKEVPKNLIWQFQLNEGENHFSNAIESYIDGLRIYFNLKIY